MKKLVLAFSLAVTAAIVFACDGNSNVVECAGDEDCPDDLPFCDTSSDPGVCVPEDDECTEDLECQITESGGSDACEGQADCGGSERCIPGSAGEAHCVESEGAGCAGGSVAVTTDDVDGNSESVCVFEDKVCNAGTCEDA